MDKLVISSVQTGPKSPVEAVNRPRPEQALANSAADKSTIAPATDISAEQVVEAIGKINDFIQITRRDLQFSLHEETGVTVITVLDAETEEVIRQIPAEEVLAVAANLEEIRGLLFRAKA